MRVLVILIVAILMPGCASTYQAAGYLESYRRLHEGSFFKQQYLAPQAQFQNYSKVQVLTPQWDYLKTSRVIREDELRQLAIYFRDSIRKELEPDYILLPEFAPVDAYTVVVRPVITYLKPTRRAWNSMFLFMAFPVFSGKTAFEAKLLDGETKEVLAEVAEMQTHFNSHKGALKHWAKEIRRLMDM